LFKVGKTSAVFVGAETTNQKKITNAFGGTLYYAGNSEVSTSSSSIATGESINAEANTWLISNTECNVAVQVNPGAVGTATQIPGFFGGLWNPVAATSGTDTTPAEKKLFVTSLFLPVSKKITGIGYLVGSVGGTNKVVAGIWNAAGTLLAASSETTEGATVGTAAEIQELALVTPYQATGPQAYFIGLTMNGNTARLRTIPKNTAGNNVFGAELSLAEKNKLAAITPPTSFTADKAPVTWVY
jgi:hypothetical protein